jgi:hypothetical protein
VGWPRRTCVKTRIRVLFTPCTIESRVSIVTQPRLHTGATTQDQHLPPTTLAPTAKHANRRRPRGQSRRRTNHTFTLAIDCAQIPAYQHSLLFFPLCSSLLVSPSPSVTYVPPSYHHLFYSPLRSTLAADRREVRGARRALCSLYECCALVALRHRVLSLHRALRRIVSFPPIHALRLYCVFPHSRRSLGARRLSDGVLEIFSECSGDTPSHLYVKRFAKFALEY